MISFLSSFVDILIFYSEYLTYYLALLLHHLCLTNVISKTHTGNKPEAEIAGIASSGYSDLILL